jgi:hypothetical protein
MLPGSWLEGSWLGEAGKSGYRRLGMFSGKLVRGKLVR